MESTQPDTPSQDALLPRSRSSWKRRLALTAIALLVLLIGMELFARFYLGLGDPPLSIADPQIEYLFKPSTHYHRFGNNITYNAYSMRSGPLTPKKTDPNELRILVVGDSVVNGGSQTDDHQLATALLQDRLHDLLKKPVYVGNISAGSWGPPNELAYLKRFGCFDADVLVLVLNSADYCDAPTFEPTVGIAPEYPDHPPMLAIQEGFSRYLLPRLRTPAPEPNVQPAPTPQAIAQCQDAIRQIIELARASGIKQILILQHLEKPELADPAESIGHSTIAATVRSLGIEPIQLGPAFTKAIKAGQNPYRDPIHPNALGQQLIADVLFDHLVPALSK